MADHAGKRSYNSVIYHVNIVPHIRVSDVLVSERDGTAAILFRRTGGDLFLSSIISVSTVEVLGTYHSRRFMNQDDVSKMQHYPCTLGIYLYQPHIYDHIAT